MLPLPNKYHHKGNNMYSFPFDASDADGSSGAAVYESNGDDDTLILHLAGRKLAAAAACCYQCLHIVSKEATSLECGQPQQ